MLQHLGDVSPPGMRMSAALTHLLPMRHRLNLTVRGGYCRVKGVQGLWVVDASVMPCIPRSGGTHATVVMIGERVIDWIASSKPRLTAQGKRAC
jgi:choline dehydrogenase-like flavoprotein